MTEEKKTLPLFPTSLAVQALKGTPYKNSASALAEIVDNAYDAGAKDIHVAIITEKDSNDGMPYHIAVLDNGKGMNSSKLHAAFQYGNGENLKQESRGKIGRWGVGLLTATINQCNSLQVWSWTDGWDEGEVKKAWSGQVKFNGDDVKNNEVEYPSKQPFPSYFDKIFRSFPDIGKNLKSGTLVVWKDFYKFSWKKPETFVDNLAFECGRIYRNFIAAGKVKIVVSSWQLSSLKDESDIQILGEEKVVEIVDPMFLKKWPDPHLAYFYSQQDVSLFEPWAGQDGDVRVDEEGNPKPREYPVYDKNNKLVGYYRILASHRRIRTVVGVAKGADPGSMDFGKLARRLEGVSILRAGRELTLEPNWLPSDKTTARWLGVSIDFDESLDDYLGVDNTKQSAPSLSRLARYSKKEEEIREREIADNEIVAEIAIRIHNIIDEMHKEVSKERKGTRDKKKNESLLNISDPELKKMTGISKQRNSEGHTAESDKEEPQNDLEELKKGYKGTFVEVEDPAGKKDVPADSVRPDKVIEIGLKVDFVKEPNGGEIFRVKERSGVIIISLNQNHPLFDHLDKVLCPNKDEDDEGVGNISCQEQLKEMKLIIQQLFYCYGRAECEAFGAKKGEFQAVRLEWGRIAERMMREYNDG